MLGWWLHCFENSICVLCLGCSVRWNFVCISPKSFRRTSWSHWELMGFYLRVSAVQWLLFRVEARGHDCRRPYCLSHAARVWELEMACFEILKRSFLVWIRAFFLCAPLFSWKKSWGYCDFMRCYLHVSRATLLLCFWIWMFRTSWALKSVLLPLLQGCSSWNINPADVGAPGGLVVIPRAINKLCLLGRFLPSAFSCSQQTSTFICVLFVFCLPQPQPDFIFYWRFIDVASWFECVVGVISWFARACVCVPSE